MVETPSRLPALRPSVLLSLPHTSAPTPLTHHASRFTHHASSYSPFPAAPLTARNLISRYAAALCQQASPNGSESSISPGRTEIRRSAIATSTSRSLSIHAWIFFSVTRSRIRYQRPEDRKSTRRNSSHLGISYAVFCL